MAEDGTSRLSAYLRFDMPSGRQVGAALGEPDPIAGRAAFWRQMAWRDFFPHLLARHPNAARGALRPEFDRVWWEREAAAFDRWRNGETGFPLVDAAMRQLATEGRMHNRARMVTASFLVKDLLIDWRRGESYFMRALVDGDPASNNGGWQWMTGTGTDAAPYFRILNPTLQARRFDPDGVYIRRHLPERRHVPDRRIHEPWTMTPEEQRAARCRIGNDYRRRWSITPYSDSRHWSATELRLMSGIRPSHRGAPMLQNAPGSRLRVQRKDRGTGNRRGRPAAAR
jgi:deoxyribodipyrimidine photo-lyase